MDFTIGMKCPACKNQNSFVGGHFGRADGTMVNYNCSCGFRATLVMPNQGYEGFEIKFIKEE